MTTPEPLPQSELERIKALCEQPYTGIQIYLSKCVAEVERLRKLVPPDLDGTIPLTLYFANDKDKDDFIKACQKENPNLLAQPL